MFGATNRVNIDNSMQKQKKNKEKGKKRGCITSSDQRAKRSKRREKRFDKASWRERRAEGWSWSLTARRRVSESLGGWKRGNVPWGSERRFSSAVSMVSSGGGRSGRVNVDEIFILRVSNERKKEKWALFEVGNAS